MWVSLHPGAHDAAPTRGHASFAGMRGKKAVVTLPVVALAGSLLWSPSGVRASDFWDEVRTPGLAAYRAAIAHGAEELAENRARAALERAETAVAHLPKRAEAHVLRGRALARLGQQSLAAEAFEHALALDPEALDDAQSAREATECAMRVGRLGLARDVLLRLLSRTRDARVRRSARLLCAHVLLASGPEHLRRALRLYREALRDGDESLEALLSLALALHRSGDHEGARVIAARVADAGHIKAKLLPPFMPASERHSRMALLHSALGQRVDAKSSWSDAARSGGPWVSHAQAAGAPNRRQGR